MFLKFINTIKRNINTLLLLLILMMMFGEYSQKYYVGDWGSSWGLDIIAPVIYYASGAVALGIIILLIVSGIGLYIKWLKERIDDTEDKIELD